MKDIVPACRELSAQLDRKWMSPIVVDRNAHYRLQGARVVGLGSSRAWTVPRPVTLAKGMP